MRRDVRPGRAKEARPVSSRWWPERRGRGDERSGTAGVCSGSTPGNAAGAQGGWCCVRVPQACACPLLSSPAPSTSSLVFIPQTRLQTPESVGEEAMLVPDSSCTQASLLPQLRSTFCGGSRGKDSFTSSPVQPVDLDTPLAGTIEEVRQEQSLLEGTASSVTCELWGGDDLDGSTRQAVGPSGVEPVGALQVGPSVGPARSLHGL